MKTKNGYEISHKGGMFISSKGKQSKEQFNNELKSLVTYLINRAKETNQAYCLYIDSSIMIAIEPIDTLESVDYRLPKGSIKEK